ncbi:MAG: pyridoxamine 5'-phosphate oxidase family protein [Gordonia sp. (in: high G+C Gram-positive bacteria)]
MNPATVDNNDKITREKFTEVNRYRELQSFEKADLYDVLDSALIAHVAYLRDGIPVVIPMAYARDGDAIVMHGSTGARLSRSAAGGYPLSATVTILDGLLYEPSMFASGVNYRSAMVFGEATPVGPEDVEAKIKVISDRFMPGRWSEAQKPTKKELAATFILRLPLDRASVKVRKGQPDYDAVPGLWTGYVKITTTLGEAVSKPGVDVPVSPSVALARDMFANDFGTVPE